MSARVLIDMNKITSWIITHSPAFILSATWRTLDKSVPTKRKSLLDHGYDSFFTNTAGVLSDDY